MDHNDSFLNTVCSKNAPQLDELSLGFTRSNVDVHRLENCLMALKPTLKKLSFSSNKDHSDFWNQFIIKYLENNGVLRALKIKFEFPKRVNVKFLERRFNRLNLTSLLIIGFIQSASMHSIAYFVSHHTSLKHVGVYLFTYRSESDHLPSVRALFESVAQNGSILEVDMTFGLKVKESDVLDSIGELVSYCKILSGRGIKMNGLSVENIIRDLNAGINRSFTWNMQGNQSIVDIGIASEKLQLHVADD